MRRRCPMSASPSVLSVFFSLLLLLTVTSGDIARAQTGETEAAPIAAGNDHPSDAEIDRRIEEIYDQIEGLQGVLVTVKSGVVTLRGRVREFALADQAETIARRVEGVVSVSNDVEEVTSVSERLVPVMERLSRRGLQAVNYIPLLLVAIAVFVVVALAGWWAAARSWPWDRMSPNAFIADLLRTIVRLIFLGIGLVLALDILGATALLTTILGAAGIVGLALGFAVRDTVENYIASILLSIRQPFRPKDYVSIDDKAGLVIRLTSRATVLMSLEGNHIRIPNATVYKGTITNYSRNPERRFSFELGLDPDCNLQTARQLGMETIAGLDFVLDDPPVGSWITDIGDSSVVMWFGAWINQTETNISTARSEAIRLTKLALENNGITLPEPTYRLRVDEAEAVAQVKPSKRGKTAKPEPLQPAETTAVADTSADDAVTKKVDEDRALSDQENLLNDEAPSELD